jgi:hypothetical protein
MGRKCNHITLYPDEARTLAAKFATSPLDDRPAALIASEVVWVFVPEKNTWLDIWTSRIA